MKNKKLKISLAVIFLFFIFLNSSSSVFANFETIKKKQTSYLDFLLLKLENKLLHRIKILQNQMFPTRIQYSYVATNVNYNNKNEKITINIRGIMDKGRYTKKKYKQKLSDCNIVRNLIFYKKTGYKFFTQKRDVYFSEDVMVDIFKKYFLDNISLNEKEIEFLLDNMMVNVQIFHPVNKTELTCNGKANAFELK